MPNIENDSDIQIQQSYIHCFTNIQLKEKAHEWLIAFNKTMMRISYRFKLLTKNLLPKSVEIKHSYDTNCKASLEMLIESSLLEQLYSQ
ncbi:8001_t:CDS:2 [Gigaspora rosea]|nr:8001_t:CDS:2 [Gigaspora rosea]